MNDLSKRNDFCVYIHTSPSGKTYVGQTCGNPKRRWSGGHGYRSNRYFWSAIQKYGWKSFKHDILIDGLNQDDANFWEQRLIRFFNSDDRRFGYNIQEGGRSAGGMSDEAKAHMVAVKSGLNAPNARAVAVFNLEGKRIGTYGCTIFAADAYGIKRSTVLTHLSKRSGTCGGYIFRYVDDVGDVSQLPQNEVYKPNEKRSLRSANNRKAKSINVYELDGTFICQFRSVSEASEYLRVGASSVCEALHRSNGTCGRKIVRYAECVSGCYDLDISVPVAYKQNLLTRKPVCQYTRSGKFVASYGSITIASETTGINLQAISRCLRGHGKCSGGFQWKYDMGDHSDIQRAKTNTEVRKERRAYPYKPVWRLDPVTHERLERYESLRAASRAVSVDKANIQAVIKGKKKTCRGYGWEYDV